MFLTTLDFFGETQAPIEVDSSGIDVSEFEQEEDKNFLMERGTELLRIDLKAENTKARIARAIDGRAEDAKGKLIYEIQEKFRSENHKRGALTRYFHSLGFWDKTNMAPMGLERPENFTASLGSAFQWANAYRGAKEMAEKLADSYTEEEIQAKIAAQTQTNLAKIYTSFSDKDKKEMYESASQYTKKQIVEEAKKPERQLNKVKEELEIAKKDAEVKVAAFDEAMADPKITVLTNQYKKANSEQQYANTVVTKLEKKIKDLEEQITARDKNEEKTAKTIDKLQSDIARLNSPEEEIKQRMLATSNALIATLPNVHSHLQRFYTDIQHYDKDTVLVLEEHIKLVQSLIDAHL